MQKHYRPLALFLMSACAALILPVLLLWGNTFETVMNCTAILLLLLTVMACMFAFGLRGLVICGIYAVVLLLTVFLRLLWQSSVTEIAGSVILFLLLITHTPEKLAEKLTPRIESVSSGPYRGSPWHIAALYRYFRLRLTEPSYSFRNASVRARIIRVITCILIFALSVVCFVLAFRSYDGQPLTILSPVFLWGVGGTYAFLLTFFLFQFGFLRAPAALICALLAPAAVYGILWVVGFASKKSLWLSILWLVAVLTLIVSVLLYLFRRRNRVNYDYTDTFTRGDKLISLPLDLRAYARSHVYRYTLQSEVFRSCETYFFRDLPADLLTFCRRNGYVFADFTASVISPVITYEIYAPKDQKTARRLARFFAGARCDTCTCEVSEDDDYSSYRLLLPTQTELFALYHSVLVPNLPGADAPDAADKHVPVEYRVLFRSRTDGETYCKRLRERRYRPECKEFSLRGTGTDRNPREDADEESEGFTCQVCLTVSLALTTDAFRAVTSELISVAEPLGGELVDTVINTSDIR